MLVFSLKTVLSRVPPVNRNDKFRASVPANITVVPVEGEHSSAQTGS